MKKLTYLDFKEEPFALFKRWRVAQILELDWNLVRLLIAEKIQKKHLIIKFENELLSEKIIKKGKIVRVEESSKEGFIELWVRFDHDIRLKPVIEVWKTQKVKLSVDLSKV